MSFCEVEWFKFPLPGLTKPKPNNQIHVAHVLKLHSISTHCVPWRPVFEQNELDLQIGCAKQSVVKPGYRKTARGCWGRDSKWQTSRWPSVTSSFWENLSLMWQLRAKFCEKFTKLVKCAFHKFTWSVTMSKQPDWTHAGSWGTFCCCCCYSYNAVGSGRLYIHELNRKSRQPQADNIDLEGDRGKIWLAIQPPSKETNVML